MIGTILTKILVGQKIYQHALLKSILMVEILKIATVRHGVQFQRQVLPFIQMQNRVCDQKELEDQLSNVATIVKVIYYLLTIFLQEHLTLNKENLETI